MKKRILFVYGYGGSPASTMCTMLRKYLPKERFDVVSYVYPQHDCALAVTFLQDILASEPFDMVVGTSLGAFITLCLDTKLPKVVVNPCMRPLDELPRLTPRPDHPDDVQPSPELVATYQPFEERLFATNHLGEPIVGFFADHDELMGFTYFDVFKEQFGEAHIIPGPHFGNNPGLRQVAAYIAS